MAYTLEQLSDDIRATLKADSGISGKQQVCKFVSKALLDREFIDQHPFVDNEAASRSE